MYKTIHFSGNMKMLIIRSKISLRFWWIFLFSGVVLILLGLYVLTNPSMRFTIISLCIAVTFFVNGLIEIYFSLTNRKKISGWGWYLAGSILDLIICAIFITNPILASATLPLLLGLWLLVRTMFLIGRSIELNHWGLPHWQWLLLFGMAGFIFCGTNIYNRLFETAIVVFWTGATLVTVGLFYVCFGLFARNLQDNTKLNFD